MDSSLTDIKAVFAARLNALLDSAGAPSTGFGRSKHLAGLVEVGVSTAGKWLVGSSIPEIERLLQLCRIFNCTLNDLFGQSVQPPVAPAEPPPNGGSHVVGPILAELAPHNGREPTLAIFREAADITKGIDIYLHKIDSNVMEPFVIAGDWVALQPVSEVFSDGVYVFCNGPRVYVRRVQPQASGGFRLLTENHRYQPETVDLSTNSEVRVVGRVVARILIGR